MSFLRGCGLLRSQVRSFATEVQQTSVKVPESILSHAKQPPKYVLATLRNFPSLEPQTFQPIPTSFLNAPLRRDILWKAVIYDADNKRVGASNPKGRSDMGYSRKKLAPQKGTGRARVGDRGSPTRHDGGVALARTAPNDFTTDLPKKVYALAVRIALSDKYRKGELILLDKDLEFPTDDDLATRKFLKAHGLQKTKLLFVTNEYCENLLKSTEPFKSTIDVVQKEGLQVKDVLRAHKICIDINSLEWLYNQFDNMDSA